MAHIADSKREVRRMFALRMKDSDKAEIDRRASARNMSMGEYMVRASLGELEDASTTTERFKRLEDRIATLERAAQLGSFE